MSCVLRRRGTVLINTLMHAQDDDTAGKIGAGLKDGLKKFGGMFGSLNELIAVWLMACYRIRKLSSPR